MKQLGEVLNLSVKFLEGKGVPSPRRDVEELLAHVLGLKRLDLYLQFDRPLEEEEISRFREYIKRKAAREPRQYIQKEVEFLGCKIGVDPSVLIPRQETEILVSHILEEVPDTPRVVWDVCTGSGCIGIALKKKKPSWTVVLSDLSEAALDLAAKNARLNQVDLTLLQGDLLNPFKGQRSDLVVCNPPYVSLEEYASLELEVRGFEPKSALVGGVSGLEFYERLEKELPSFLNPGSKIYFEIGSGQGGKLLTLFSNFKWKEGRVRSDWSGRDRFFDSLLAIQ